MSDGVISTITWVRRCQGNLTAPDGVALAVLTGITNNNGVTIASRNIVAAKAANDEMAAPRQGVANGDGFTSPHREITALNIKEVLGHISRNGSTVTEDNMVTIININIINVCTTNDPQRAIASRDGVFSTKTFVNRG